jgi:hypothetical protein
MEAVGLFVQLHIVRNVARFEIAGENISSVLSWMLFSCQSAGKDSVFLSEWMGINGDVPCRVNCTRTGLSTIKDINPKVYVPP